MIAEVAGMAGISVWRATYKVLAPVAVPDPEPDPETVDWFLLQSDNNEGGTAGGVDPYVPE